MSDWSGFEVVKATAYTGVSQWKALAEEIERQLPELTAKLRQAMDAEPWGPGSTEGDAFFASHFGGVNPPQILTRCDELPKEFLDAGDRVRKNVDNHFTTDQAIAEDVARGVNTRQV
ncbi:hypothetical protein ACFXJ8_20385 [Nonomuraea sp. NPDC059194]|uniref:hypothetical protein n=1 Tax=Nonomuraea sp. NPDC059194 TaxID=3346764 RepID=UPI00369B9890